MNIYQYQVVAHSVHRGLTVKSNPCSFGRALKRYQELKAFYSSCDPLTTSPMLIVIGRL